MGLNHSIQAPCKGCQNRYLHCHSVCKKYLAFREEIFTFNELKKEFQQKRGLTGGKKKNRQP